MPVSLSTLGRIMSSGVKIVLFTFLLSPIWALPWAVESLLHKRNVNRVSFKECNLEPSERRDCGHYGIDEESCYARECCWGESSENGVPWCYHSIPTSKSRRCVNHEGDREACGWAGIRKEQCLASDCCWRPSGNWKEWCFKKKREPVYTGDCGHTAIKPMTIGRIIGGDEAIPHSWPWIISMQGGGHHICGGSLINHQWVLSAGHCDQGSDGISIVMGAHNVSDMDTESTKVTVPIAKTFVHPNYGYTPPPPDADFGGVMYDYMLVKMEYPVEFNDVISPVCLAKEPPHAGKHCYSMGWGLEEFSYSYETGHQMSVPDLLQQFMSPVVDRDYCNGTEMYNTRIHETAMCAGYEEGGRGNCFGDSGGPLVCKWDGRWEQVGIVSWGEPCALAMYPTVYAEVTQMLEWIENTVADN